jgi:hypothetical protein
MTDVKPLNLGSESQPGFTPTSPVSSKKFPSKLVVMFLALVALGIVSGYGLFNLKGGGGVKRLQTEVTGPVSAGDTFGVEDSKAFTDSAEGEMTAGGIDGEGSHHLIREGGESQYVYLTSSIIDLDQFVGKNVKVWGQTFTAQKAGWLMDVGRLEVK